MKEQSLLTKRTILILFITAIILSATVALAHDANHINQHSEPLHIEHHTPLGELLPLWSAIPFIGILLSIAVFPLVAPHFWHKQFP
ncbi:hypothetical protein HN843_03840 [bacterium]|nr:hypothetical protein [bacterium]